MTARGGDPGAGREAPPAFVHGRPGPHPFHGHLAEAVGAEPVFVDFRLRWHDRETSRLRRYASWIVCAATFPERRRRPFILSEGLHLVPVVMRLLHLVSHDQPIVALLDDEALYFLRAGRYPAVTAGALRAALRRYDALVCVGEMQAELARELTGGSRAAPSIHRVPSAVSDARLDALAGLSPDLDGARLTFVGNGPAGWRGWYKGLDLLLETVARLRRRRADVRLTVVGEWEEEYVGEARRAAGIADDAVRFTGRLPDLDPVFRETDLYLHLGRGEAFGISVVEAMAAGIPAIVSGWTGAREAVRRVDDELVVPLDAAAAAERVAEYLDRPPAGRRRLGARAREVAREYTPERAAEAMRAAISEILGGPGRREDAPC